MNRVVISCLGLMLLAFGAGAQADSVKKETTDALNGARMTYEYSSGRAYDVKLEEAGASYRYLTGSKPDKWWGPFPYQAMQVEGKRYFLSWFEKEYGDFVTLLVDFEKKLIHGSALIQGKNVHFHRARITEFRLPDPAGE